MPSRPKKHRDMECEYHYSSVQLQHSQSGKFGQTNQATKCGVFDGYRNILLVESTPSGQSNLVSVEYTCIPIITETLLIYLL